MTQSCERCNELFNAVKEILDHLTRLTQSQAEAFEAGDSDEFARLDKELENSVGEKERRIGAYREHRHKHGLPT